MLKILFFAIGRKFKANFTNADSTIGFVLTILYVLFFLLNGVMIGFLMDKLADSDTASLSVEALIKGINVFFCGFMVLLHFFPTYEHRAKIVSKAHPISFNQRWSINFLYDLLKPTHLGVLGNFVIINLLSTSYTNLDLITSLLLFFAVFITLQNFKALLEDSHKNTRVLWLGWSSFVLIGGVLFAIEDFNGYRQLSFGLTIFLWQLILALNLEKQSVGASNQSNFLEKFTLQLGGKSPVYLAFIKNNKTRTLFFIQTAMKVFFTYFILQAAQKGLFGNGFDVVCMLYLCPLILFTYYANNLFGFYREIWLNTHLKTPKNVYKVFAQLITIPILIDFAITAAVATTQGMMNGEMLVFYAITTVALFFNGLFFSIYRPLLVEQAITFSRMNGNTNGWATLSCFVIVGVTTYAVKYPIALALWVPLLATAIWAIHRHIRKDNRLMYGLYRKLFA